jgi:thiosulfate dehydrogenase [quinone] large subunit
MAVRNQTDLRASRYYIPEPALARFLFGDTRFAWFWLIVRLYVGYEWLTAGWEKLSGVSINYDSFGQHVNGGAWVFNDNAGAAIQGFVKGAIAKANGPFPDVSGWYAWFLQHVVLPNSVTFAYIITFGELLVGLALILGFLTGIAAFFGVVMNVNYLLAGAVSTNPILAILGSLIMLAWRIAGYWGLDHWVLRWLGTPWSEGQLRRRLRNRTVNEAPPESLPPQQVTPTPVPQPVDETRVTSE